MTKQVDSTSTGSVDRREFLKGAAAGAAGAAGAIVSGTASSQQAPANARPAVTRPTEADARADFVPPEPRVDARFIRHPGSDYMVDVLKALDLTTSPSIPARLSKACTNRSSITAATASPRS